MLQYTKKEVISADKIHFNQNHIGKKSVSQNSQSPIIIVLRICSYCVLDIDGLVQDCSNSIANALELLQSCAKPLIC